jgi:hypothetical protein
VTFSVASKRKWGVGFQCSGFSQDSDFPKTDT